MEWDLCPGNLLMDNGHLWLFDFGYMYPFQPLQSYNSNGLQDPLFHACERFETRFFFGRLLEENQPEAVATVAVSCPENIGPEALSP